MLLLEQDKWDIKSVCFVALGGYETIIQDMNEQSLIDAKNKLEAIIGKWVHKGKISSEAKEAAFRRLSFTNTLKEAVSNADFVIEAVVEKVRCKTKCL